jgi:hypothetical protein
LWYNGADPPVVELELLPPVAVPVLLLPPLKRKMPATTAITATTTMIPMGDDFSSAIIY